MYMVAYAALMLAQSGMATQPPMRLRATADCIAVPLLMSQRDVRGGATARAARRDVRRPTPRCFRLSAR